MKITIPIVVVAVAMAMAMSARSLAHFGHRGRLTIWLGSLLLTDM